MESDIVKKLKAEIMNMQGQRPSVMEHGVSKELEPFAAAFPGGTFPIGVHEFISETSEQAAATSGFMAGLLSKVVSLQDGPCLWISASRTIFPVGLQYFNIQPERIIFVDAQNRDLLWMIEQALKCDAVSVVVGEIKDMDLTQSRRLQLAIEHSRVPAFLHRYCPRSSGAVASICRWKIMPLPSLNMDGMPGIGFASWQVQLLKVRNGEPGNWQLSWIDKQFTELTPAFVETGVAQQLLRKVG